LLVWEGELIENQTEWIIEEATQLTNWTEICATTEFTFPFTNTGAIRVFRRTPLQDESAA
jgi:hypothetical protein